MDIFYGILTSTLVMSIPLVLAALGGVFSVRSGIMALGLESMILFGAFCAVTLSYYTNSALIGLLAGILGGMFIGLLHGLLSAKFKVNQVISGIGLNLLATSTTTLLMQIIWGNKGNSEFVQGINTQLSIFKDVPILNKFLANQSILLLVTIIACIFGYYLLFKTPFGLRLRMVGENPKAASSMGVPVRKYKYIGVMICGVFAGLAGAYLSLDNLNMFVRNMSAGRGYIALAIAILSRYNPIGVLICGILFGFFEAIQIYVQSYGIPSQLVQMIPYIVTLLVLAIGVKNIQPPKGVGEHDD